MTEPPLSSSRKNAEIFGTVPWLRRMASEHPRLFDVTLLIVLAGLVIFPALGQTKHFASHEILHAEIMREMAETGDFVETKCVGVAIVDKPPVIHAPAAALMRLTGKQSVTIARLPSALAGVAGILATYGIGLVLFKRKTALLAAIALLGIPGYAILARLVLPDMTLCASILLSCLGLAVGMRERGVGRRTFLFTLAGVAAGVGVLTKGPYGILFPVFFAILAPMGRADLTRPRFGWIGFTAALLAAACVWAVPVYLRDNGAYLHKVIFQADLNPALQDGGKPWLMYFWVMFAFSAPLCVFLPFAVFDWARGRYSAALAMAAAILIVVTLVPKKRDHYLLPLYPFLALGIAEAVQRRYAESRLVRRLAWVLIPGSVAAFPIFYAVIQPLAFRSDDAELGFARALQEIVGPRAHVFYVTGHQEFLAWSTHRSSGITYLYEKAPVSFHPLETATPGSYLVIDPKLVTKILNVTGPLAMQPVLERSVKRQKMAVFRLDAQPPGH